MKTYDVINQYFANDHYLGQAFLMLAQGNLGRAKEYIDKSLEANLCPNSYYETPNKVYYKTNNNGELLEYTDDKWVSTSAPQELKLSQPLHWQELKDGVYEDRYGKRVQGQVSNARGPFYRIA